MATLMSCAVYVSAEKPSVKHLTLSFDGQVIVIGSKAIDVGVET